MPIYSIVFGAGVILFLTTALTNLVIRKVSGGRSKLSLKKGIEKN
jgi:hypothetical protein